MDLTESQLPPNGNDAAQYIAAMAHELRTVAARADLGFLAYLLSMVEDEAATSASRQEGQGESA